MYKNLDNWNTYEGFAYGSGTSTQEWVIEKSTGTIGLFKKRKDTDVTDNISEKLASDIASIIGIQCAKIDLATRRGDIGLISYKINSDIEILEEGINYISKIYPCYNRDTLIDEDSNEKYSLEIILKSIEGLGLEKDLFKIFIFDCIIGNSDRHHSNWATLRNDKGIRICPIYDNASSLCSYIKDDQIKKYFNDRNWFNAQVDSKSKSLIRINGKKVRHSDFVRYLKQNYYFETIDFIYKIKERFTNEVVINLMNGYNKVLSEYKIKMLKDYLICKKDIILDIYNIK